MREILVEYFFTDDLMYNSKRLSHFAIFQISKKDRKASTREITKRCTCVPASSAARETLA